eukprot:864789-Pelagomonas_calceolata.AAC.1
MTESDLKSNFKTNINAYVHDFFYLEGLCDSETIFQVLKADLHIANKDKSCRFAQCAVHMCLRNLGYTLQKVWREADALSP